IRKLGEPQVIFDSLLMDASADQLTKAMVNKGFLNAHVKTDTIKDDKKRKINVRYSLFPGAPHTVANINYIFPDSTFRDLVMADSSNFLIHPGDALDRTKLDLQRDVIVESLKNKGYYGFTKEFITFNADTTAGSKLVDLTMTLNPPYQDTRVLKTHEKYLIRDVVYITDYNPSAEEGLRHYQATDSVYYKGLNILYGPKHYLRPEVLYENCFITPGEEYRQSEVDKTYQALSRLTILKFNSIKFLPAGKLNGMNLLDAYILLTPGKSQSISMEIEGTNSEGDLGVAASLTYTHRNVGKGSETLTGKIRGAYESLSGNLDGLLHDRYMEYSFEGGVTFPKFKAPFLT
ncbi:MAG: outer membrane protein assembly factor, partial [Muribaculaceae bacterium]|nr:outer membrane protein assembly factor [Muribaculaceae bacterium]